MKGAGVIENEILGHLAGVVRKHLPLHTDDLDGKVRGVEIWSESISPGLVEKRMTAP
jgi:hypothetical protein